MFWKRSFKGKIESANRVFTATIEKNQAKMQKLSDDNTELEAMKQKAARQIEEISKFIA